MKSGKSSKFPQSTDKLELNATFKLFTHGIQHLLYHSEFNLKWKEKQWKDTMIHNTHTTYHTCNT